jgi:hypothetical protein
MRYLLQLGKVHWIILADGLDEFYDDEDLAKTDQECLVAELKAMALYTRVKICCSSRPDWPFTKLLDGLPSIALHKLTRDDIRDFCKDALSRKTF